MPARLRDLIRAAAALGVTVERPRSGSHWKARRDGFRPYPIPAGNAERTEIGDQYIRGMCRALGLDETELRKLL